MLLLIFQVFLAVTIAKSAFEESLEPNDTMISETFAQISRISLEKKLINELIILIKKNNQLIN